MPDNVAAAALAMAFNAGGAVKTVKTTPLMSISEGIAAMKKAAECAINRLKKRQRRPKCSQRLWAEATYRIVARNPTNSAILWKSALSNSIRICVRTVLRLAFLLAAISLGDSPKTRSAATSASA